MKVNQGGAPGGPALDALREGVAALRKQDAALATELRAQQGRSLQAEAAARAPAGAAQLPEVGRDVINHLQAERTARVRELEVAIMDTRRLLAPLDGILRNLEVTRPAAEVTSRFDAELYHRSMLVGSIGAVQKMLEAAGPELAKQFPTAQLALVDKSLREEMKELRKRGTAAERTVMNERLAARGPNAPTPVLHLDQLPDLASAARSLARQLPVAGLEGDLLAAGAKLDGAAKEHLTRAVQAFALLADYATGSIDYRRVGAQFTGPGATGQDRSDHRVRNYGAWATTSRNRQEESRATLGQALKDALAAEDPSAAVEATLGAQLLRELGLSAKETAGWKPTLAGMLAALDGEAFAPVRAFVELIPNGFSGRYGGEDVEAMRQAARSIARAVVEGRYPEAVLEHPANVAQLAVLPTEAQRARWIAGHQTEALGTFGQKMSTREAEGLDRFWATKIGGPSHGFDNMTHCTLSIAGNARTKAIIVEDESWHQPAARAYLRLLGNDRGRPMLYVEDPQIDFTLQRSIAKDTDGIADRVVAHAIHRAKELGADLVVSDLLRPALDRLGATYQRYGGKIVLEPSAVRCESSDSMLGHDQPQGSRLETFSRFPFVEVNLG